MEIRTYPPQVFARLAPDVYFQRNFEKHERPTCRQFLEARSIEVSSTSDSNFAHSLGSAMARSGDSIVICGVTGGLTNFIGEGGIYANVEIPRNGSTSGAPTGEEQVLTQRVHELIKAAQIPSANFYVSDQQELVLNAEIIVISRTGPSMDVVWACLVEALRATKIPVFVQDERTLEMVPTEEYNPLELPYTLARHHFSYGVYKDVVFADIDGPIEEENIVNRMSVARANKEKVMGFSLNCATGCSLDTVTDILKHSQKRAD